MSAVPQRIDRYLLEGELGRGSFGAVYRAKHAVMGRPVALKVLHPERTTSPSVLERFLGEARAVAAIGSPHIVQVFDAGLTAEGKAFVAMELLEGEDLASHLERAGRLPAGRAVEIAREVARGLAAAHRAGVVHRDLKPANIYLARGPDGRAHAKVLDFGVSKMMRPEGEELTMTGTMLGTPHYMAPEQLTSSRTVDGRADLYALGTVLYEMVSGTLPYDASTLAALISSKMSDAPRPLSSAAPDCPGPLAALVLRLLSWDPNARFSSAEELDEALGALAIRSSAPSLPRTHGAEAMARTEFAQSGVATRTTPAPTPAPTTPRTVDSLPGIVNASTGATPGTTEAPFGRWLVVGGIGFAAFGLLAILVALAILVMAYLFVTRASETTGAPPAVSAPTAPAAPATPTPATPTPATTPSASPVAPIASPTAPTLPAAPPTGPSLPAAPPTAPSLPTETAPTTTAPTAPAAPDEPARASRRWSVRGNQLGAQNGSVDLILAAVTPLLDRCHGEVGHLVSIQAMRFSTGGGMATYYPTTDDPGDPVTACVVGAFADAVRTLPPGQGICRFQVTAE